MATPPPPSSSSSPLLLFLLLVLGCRSATADYYCSAADGGTYYTGSAYQDNLAEVLLNLARWTSPYMDESWSAGYFPNKVFGRARCESASTCVNCLGTTVEIIHGYCNNMKVATVILRDRALQYSYTEAFSPWSTPIGSPPPPYEPPPSQIPPAVEYPPPTRLVLPPPAYESPPVRPIVADSPTDDPAKLKTILPSVLCVLLFISLLVVLCIFCLRSRSNAHAPTTPGPLVPPTGLSESTTDSRPPPCGMLEPKELSETNATHNTVWSGGPSASPSHPPHDVLESERPI